MMNYSVLAHAAFEYMRKADHERNNYVQVLSFILFFKSKFSFCVFVINSSLVCV